MCAGNQFVLFALLNWQLTLSKMYYFKYITLYLNPVYSLCMRRRFPWQ